MHTRTYRVVIRSAWRSWTTLWGPHAEPLWGGSWGDLEICLSPSSYVHKRKNPSDHPNPILRDLSSVHSDRCVVDPSVQCIRIYSNPGVCIIYGWFFFFFWSTRMDQKVGSTRGAHYAHRAYRMIFPIYVYILLFGRLIGKLVILLNVSTVHLHGGWRTMCMSKCDCCYFYYYVFESTMFF